MRNSFNFLQRILQTTLFCRTAIFLTKISTPFKTAFNSMPWNRVFPHPKSHIWKSGRSNRHKSFNICTALEAFSNSEICLLLIFKQMRKRCPQADVPSSQFNLFTYHCLALIISLDLVCTTYIHTCKNSLSLKILETYAICGFVSRS